MSYRRHELRVPDGTMTVGEWIPEGWSDGSRPTTVLALHGMGSQHLIWSRLARYRPDLRIIAPDLRGIGGSRDLPGPYGIAPRVKDVLEVCDQFGVDKVIGAGHSLGAFVLLLAATQRPELFDAALFVDGGPPVAARLEVTTEEHLDRIAREGTARLAKVEFSSIEEHREFWKAHPVDHVWDDLFEAYVDNDVVEVDGVYRWTTQPAAMEQDTKELFASVRFTRALDALRMPTTLVAARVGLFDDDPAIYSDRQLEAIENDYPWIHIARVHETHYLVLLGQNGGQIVADEIAALERAVQLEEFARDVTDSEEQ